jgi:hypothetical protein
VHAPAGGSWRRKEAIVATATAQRALVDRFIEIDYRAEDISRGIRRRRPATRCRDELVDELNGICTSAAAIQGNVAVSPRRDNLIGQSHLTLLQGGAD